ncbi:hypothetical protein VCUG_02535 [Vavraia culicis subsp. floridensis]|uniref:Uncharacterized protein n=1 Tax=Vavraia culicis (isolate floridensis) TaxID=948595 RepID=L2GQT5_VAVCU|nr:uncharacterized protein VCUG_02535 [Vavraia culicis subsp. floridensis]ELA45979.1 hypothetical protein VCUG_02535 [Vavraia culicis subsp. floridensis]
MFSKLKFILFTTVPFIAHHILQKRTIPSNGVLAWLTTKDERVEELVYRTVTKAWCAVRGSARTGTISNSCASTRIMYVLPLVHLFNLSLHPFIAHSNPVYDVVFQNRYCNIKMVVFMVCARYGWIFKESVALIGWYVWSVADSGWSEWVGCGVDGCADGCAGIAADAAANNNRKNAVQLANLAKWSYSSSAPHIPWLHPSPNVHSFALLNIFDPYYHPLILLYLCTFVYLLLTSRYTMHVLVSFLGYNEVEHVMLCADMVPVLVVRRWIVGGYFGGRGYAMWAVGWCECLLVVGMCVVGYMRRRGIAGIAR